MVYDTIDCAMSSSSSIVPPPSSSSTPYGPTSTDSVHRKVLRQSVAAICKTAAFESIEGHALELLTHMLASLLTELCRLSKQLSEHASRSQPTPNDVLAALIEMGVDIASLPDLMRRQAVTGSLVIAPPRAHPITNPPQALKIGITRPHPPHIPDWLPPFPDPHTYIRSEVSGDPETSYEKVRELSSTQKRDVDVALVDFMLRLHPTIPLFRDYEAKVLREAREKLAELDRQRVARRTTVDATASSADENSEDDGGSIAKRPRHRDEDEMFELRETEQSILRTKVPSSCRLLAPTLDNRPYMSALLADEAGDDETGAGSVSVAPINPKPPKGTVAGDAGGNATIVVAAVGSEEILENPFLKPPRLPVPERK